MKRLIQFLQITVLVKHTLCNTPKLLMRQINENDFIRYDVIIRLLAVENYYNRNDYGWALYEKLRKHQLQTTNVKNEIIRFVDLIKSIEIHGLDSRSDIYIDKHFRLVNGSHRLALALYHKYNVIPCRIIRQKANADYSIRRLIEFDYTQEEIDCILNRYRALQKEFALD